MKGHGRVSRVAAAVFLLAVAGGLLLCVGCGREKKVPSPREMPTSPGGQTGGKKGGQNGGNQSLAHSAFPWEAEGTGPGGVGGQTGKPGTGQHLGRAPREEFHRRYAEGLRKMEDSQFGDAMSIFEEIVKSYPGSDEASMAEYRLAMIHFHNKNNSAALETYKRILEKYPNSPMAENARAAVTYMETFEQHEKNYVSPDVEDRQRRGR